MSFLRNIFQNSGQQGSDGGGSFLGSKAQGPTLNQLMSQYLLLHMGDGMGPSVWDEKPPAPPQMPTAFQKRTFDPTDFSSWDNFSSTGRS